MKLKSFEKDPLYSETLKYWADTWHSIAEVIERGTFGVEIINIRIVLLDIINEYTLNKFDSNNNRKVYIKLIERFLKDKYIKSYSTDLFLLKSKLEEKDNASVYIIAKKLSKKISKETFAKILFEELLTIIRHKSFNKKDRVKITELTKAIIIDLVTSGRQIEDVKYYIEDLFVTYLIDKDDISLLFKYAPENLTKHETKKFIDDLTIEKRLEIFKANLSPKEYDYHFVFPIWGMVAPSSELNKNSLLDFTLYDPTLNKNFDSNEFNKIFSYKFHSTNEKIEVINSRCNAYIKVRATSNNMAIKDAVNKHYTLVNLLNYNLEDEQKLIFTDGQYFGERMDKKHSMSGGSLNINEQETLKRDSIFLPTSFSLYRLNQIKEYSKVIHILRERKMYRELSTIISVINLMSKSIRESEENKLLNYWICIESLASISKGHNENTFGFIKEAVSNLYCLKEQYLPIHRLFNLLEFHIISTKQHGIPQDFIDDTGLESDHSEDDLISLIPFYTRLKELPFKIENVHVKDTIENTLHFYESNKFALTQLKNKKNEVLLMIDYIYKTRNQIVHNGYIDKNLITYLVKFAEGYSQSLFEDIIDEYLDNNFDLQMHFTEQKHKQKQLETKLSSDTFYSIDFLQ